MKNWINDFVHNALVHPLLPFLPIEVGNRFHDWHATIAFGLERFDELELEDRKDAGPAVGDQPYES